MQTLYHYYIAQIKREEIEQYNHKHRDYLIRVGKLKENDQNQGFQRRRKGRGMGSDENRPGNQYQEQKQEGQRRPRRQREFERPVAVHCNQNRSAVAMVHEEREIRGQGFENQRFKKKNNERIQLVNQNEQQHTFENKLPPFADERPIKSGNNNIYAQEYEDEYSQQPKASLTMNNPEKILKKQQQQPIKKTNPRQQKPLPKAPQINQLEQHAEVELFECSAGCGRKFNIKTLAKHEKVCHKVFQEKRKPFQVQKTNEEAEILKKKTSKKMEEPKLVKKDSKWKKNSDNFRNMLKAGRGEVVPPEEVVEDTRIPCPSCGRKFGESAAARHIEFCQNKSKMRK